MHKSIPSLAQSLRSRLHRAARAIQPVACALTLGAALLVGTALAGTTSRTFDLTGSGGGTILNVSFSRVWLTKGILPAGSILRGVSIDATQGTDAAGGGDQSYVGNIGLIFDPTPGNPLDGDNSLTVGDDFWVTPFPGATTHVGWGGDTGAYGVGTPLIRTKTAVDGGIPAIDLNTVAVFIGNTYDNSAGGTIYSGTITLTFDEVGGSPTPTITGAATAAPFTVVYGSASTAQSFGISGAHLTTDITATAPLGFEVSINDSSYASTATFTQSGSSASGTLYVRLAANAAAGSYNSQNIVLSSTGATDVNITTSASGNTVSSASSAMTLYAQNFGIVDTDNVNTSGFSFDYTQAGQGASGGVNYWYWWGPGLINLNGSDLATNGKKWLAGHYVFNVTVVDSGNEWGKAPTLSMASIAADAVYNSDMVVLSGGSGAVTTANKAYTSSGGTPASTADYSHFNGGAGGTQPVSYVLAFDVPQGSPIINTYIGIKFDNEDDSGISALSLTFEAASSSPTPTITGAATATPFTAVYGSASTAQAFAISGANLSASITATAPLGIEVSATGSSFGPTATFTQSGGSASGTLYVRLVANAAAGSYNSQNIVLSSTGATSVNIITSADGNMVEKATPGVTVNTGSYTYSGACQGSNSVTTTSNGAVSYIYEGTGGTTYGPSATMPTAAGSYTVTATVAEAANYYGASSTATTFSIAKATPKYKAAVGVGEMITVNFGQSGITPAAPLNGPAGGSPQWNEVASKDTVVSPLKNSAGATTSSIGFKISLSDGIDAWGTPSLDMLKCGGFNLWSDWGGGPGAGAERACYINGLTIGKKYNFYIASGRINGDSGSHGSFTTTNTTSNGQSQHVDNGALDRNGSTWVEGVNYVVFKDVEPDTNGKINFTVYEPDSKLMVNGFQLVEVVAATPAATDITYGQPLSDSVLSGTFVDETTGATVSGGMAFTSSSTVPPAGTVSHSVSFTPSGAEADNYTTGTTDVSVTVNKLPVVFAGTRNYDGTATAAVAVLTVSNKVSSDVVTVISGSAGLEGAGVGARAITSTSGLTLGGTAAGNYTLTGASGSVTISTLPVVLSGERYYNGTATAAASVLAISNILDSDDVTVASGSADLADAAAGSQTVTSPGSLALGGAAMANYTLTGVSGAVTIDPALLTVTANNRSKAQGASLAFGSGSTQFTSSGLQHSETIGSVTLACSGGSAGALAGDYPITPSAPSYGSFTASNYSIGYADGTLTVAAAANPFGDYIANAPSDQRGALDTPYHDGVVNLLKYACNLSPSGADCHTLAEGGTSGLPRVMHVGGKLRLEFVRRNATGNPGITYTPQFCTGLGGWADFTGAAISATAIDTTWERVVVEDPGAGTTRFGRVLVIQTQ
ncbi:MAG: YDG domain-containing protein [Verrucomicrobiota bacterium]